MESTTAEILHASRHAVASAREVYRRLRTHFGPAGWWPAETAFEVCVGAILVQNTSWSNAARALAALREAGLLDYNALSRLDVDRLAPLIRASGCYRVKARRLRAFLDFLGTEYGGRAEEMGRERPSDLRRRLLEVPGIGRETADCIVLYAAGLPVVVVDAYTRRVFSRLGRIAGDEPYDVVAEVLARELPRRAPLLNDFHAQIVRLAKESCRKQPVCGTCPIEGLCAKRGVSPVQ